MNEAPGRERDERLLIKNIRIRRHELQKLLAAVSNHWGYEDPIYRFYHQSYKVYLLQATTQQIVAVLQSLLPNHELNAWFMEIVASGTGNEFEMEHNENWPDETRPILEAFFHARYCLA